MLCFVSGSQTVYACVPNTELIPFHLHLSQYICSTVCKSWQHCPPMCVLDVSWSVSKAWFDTTILKYIHHILYWNLFFNILFYIFVKAYSCFSKTYTSVKIQAKCLYKWHRSFQYEVTSFTFICVGKDVKSRVVQISGD